MTSALRIYRLSCAVLVLSFLTTVVPSLAGTTGGLSGVVTDATTHVPIAGAKVTVASPSQTAIAKTDAHGNYSFVSLAPDEYTITVAKGGFDTASLSGAAVFADATQIVPVQLRETLKTIATVKSVSASSLVRSGTTADVYSINAEQQARTSVLGGGSDLNSAYSAIASVPGAYVPSSQNGYNQAVHIRGGDSSEVGYEFDGIPVNRGFDNYPGGGLSSLGQLELQVYTGATPANAEAQGLAGFINQVIKTGIYPGYLSIDSTVGGPAFYHSMNVEAGGATPDRSFSYYVGIGGYNQEDRYVNQTDGTLLGQEFGPALDYCQPPASLGPAPPPSCLTNGQPNVGQAESPGYILGPIPFGNNASAVIDRSTVLNFHISVPHKYNDLHDDIQILYDDESMQTPLYVSPIDEGLENFQGTTYGSGVLPYYSDTYQYTGTLGTVLPSNAASLITPYYFPSSPSDREPDAPLPLTSEDVQFNDQGIVKLQYQKNFSDSAYMRFYGYTYYSDYIASGPVSSWQPITGYDSGDYELNSHTRGLSLSFAKQLNPQNLVQAEASYTTSTSLRDYNEQPFTYPGGFADGFAVLVNPHDLTSGTCYALSGTVTTPTTCNNGAVLTANSPTFASLTNTANAATVSPGCTGLVSTTGQCLGGTNSVSSYTCGSGPCALYAVESGAYGEYNTVTPVFTGFSLTDEYRPIDKLLINLGLRLDSYKFIGENTTGTAARTFWFDSFNEDTCYDSQTLQLIDRTQLLTGPWTTSSQVPCSSFGSQYADTNLQNASGQIFQYNILQPRLGATYSLSRNTVLRASWGEYNEQPSAAYEQYNSSQQNLPNTLAQFYSLGFDTPGHQIQPSISYNTDFSIEHVINGTDMSFKLTPFLRETKNQIQNFYINLKSGLVSGLNAGQQTSEGFEFAFDKGDFDRNGFAAQLSFTYTNVYITYSNLGNGTTLLSPINADISNYNAYTSACAPGGADAGKKEFGQPLCGSAPAGEVAAPCYATGGVPVSNPSDCVSGDIANPYWDAPVANLFNPGARYLPYSTIPDGIGTGANAFNYPYVATLILNYKHNKFAVTPSLQFVAGNRYGAPETTPGIDPATCTGTIETGIDAGRYPYGAPGGSGYDATTCGQLPGAIPDPYTGQFDGLGEFRQPAQLLGHLQFSYDLTPRISLTLTMANLLSTCFGGQKTAFTYYMSNQVCSYGSLPDGIAPVGNIYNPGDNIQTFQKYPYEPVFGTYNDLTTSTLNPFSIYFNIKIKV